MYLRWISELDSHTGWTTITYREGRNHQNADAMSRINAGQRRHETTYASPARWDCGYVECIQCSKQFKGNRRIQPALSQEEDDDSDGFDDGPPSGHFWPPTSGSDDPPSGYDPDEGDYSLVQLVNIRST